MSKAIAISAIAKELELDPKIHAKVLIDMGLDDEFQAIGVMIRVGAMQAYIRFNALYDRCLKKYAVIEYNDRMNELSDGGL
jgi:hypothetical protein